MTTAEALSTMDGKYKRVWVIRRGQAREAWATCAEGGYVELYPVSESTEPTFACDVETDNLAMWRYPESEVHATMDQALAAR